MEILRVQYDRLSGKFVMPNSECSDSSLTTYKKLNEVATEVIGWLNLKRRSGKYSHGFLIEMTCYLIERKINVHEIYDEIGKLEGIDHRPSLTKKPQKMQPPLEGLWHKHYYQAKFITQNIINQYDRIDKYGRLEGIFAPHIGRYLHECVNEIAHEMTMGAYEQRARDRKLTGEFIVYEKNRDGSNYYLTLGEHGKWEEIRKRVDSYKEFDSDGGW